MDKRKKTNIIIIGFGNSGSSAVQDLLKEYDNVGKFRYEEPGFVTGEMNHFRLPGMIGDKLLGFSKKTDWELLENHIVPSKRPKVPLSLQIRIFIPDLFYKVYKKNEFTRSFAIRKIGLVRQQQRYYDSLLNLNHAFNRTKDLEKRFELAENWLIEVNEIFGRGKDFVIHKPILHESHLEVWPRLFDPFKIICVFREPVDHMSTWYVHNMKTGDGDFGWKFKMLFGLDSGNRRLLNLLIDSTMMRIKCMDEIEKVVGSDKILKIDFEGLVKNYESYKTIIENFIGLSPEKHKLKKAYFNPEVSVNSLNKFSDILDSLDRLKLDPMKAWYDNSLRELKKKYFPRL